MTQTSTCNNQLRLYAHQGVVILTPDGPYRVKLHLMTGDRSYAYLGADDLRTLIGLLIGELVRTMGGGGQ